MFPKISLSTRYFQFYFIRLNSQSFIISLFDISFHFVETIRLTQREENKFIYKKGGLNYCAVLLLTFFIYLAVAYNNTRNTELEKYKFVVNRPSVALQVCASTAYNRQKLHELTSETMICASSKKHGIH